ncbi:MAG: hypothetical protein LBI39_02510 [Puniceicoccales bacterium]|jgi:hypothetical protein|nr:hypothetical protein [Puniceicoccales bacterium]
MALRLIALFAAVILAINALLISLCVAVGKNLYAIHGRKLLAAFSVLLGSAIAIYLLLALLALE